MTDELERLIADNATLRTALQNHGEEAARMLADGWRQCAKGQTTTQFCGQINQAQAAIAELVGALAPFAGMMNEADHLIRSPGDRPVFAINNHGFSVGDLRKARAAITKHSPTTTKEEQK